MSNNMRELHTSKELLAALKNSKKLTAEEIRQQRVSFVLGSIDSKSSVTRDRINEVIAEQEGRAL